VFTGIVEAVGTVRAREGGRLAVACPFAGELAIGESVAVHGVCLTVETRDAEAFWVTAVPTTLARTTLGRLGPGDRVNLERSVPVGGRLGGHVVQGHVDGVGRVSAREAVGEAILLTVEPPAELLRYLVPRGAVAMDGVSLTVAERTPRGFRVAVIPHTARATTLGALAPGAEVNLEVDVLAKYVEGLLGGLEIREAVRRG
jgi:riboflavin synthase